MNWSYWEYKEWFANNDYVIVGSGIVGLNCAIQLKERFPSASILVLEKGMLPQGASTKNAGFACFGSPSELLSDLKNHSQDEVFELVKKRWEGLQLLRQTLGDSAIDYQNKKGSELFMDQELFESCQSQLGLLNQLLGPLFPKAVYEETENIFGFENIIPTYLTNNFEGQIDTGKMMNALLNLAYKKGIKIVNGIEVLNFQESNDSVFIQTSKGDFSTKNFFIATNGFSKNLFNADIKPARAQVLITKPIPNLAIEGTFHLDEGYYYFRNIDNRILFGGGRNLDFSTEETTEFGQTELVQHKLEELLKTVILPNASVEIESRWSGIMGIGNQKKAIVKKISNRVYCGVRLGGMGVAIGSTIGKELAELLD
ncbi:MAG: FAD-dependent oxidoreductase [Flavobacteriaceae bacterium]|nr:FAD-dependent oxidoreductase [Flavobacteriaceae bacterium]|tara:strand:+ start:364110 stop:365219 length:1110 start_codon:yes stop_codon:yes gene_type:complete